MRCKLYINAAVRGCSGLQALLVDEEAGTFAAVKDMAALTAEELSLPAECVEDLHGCLVSVPFAESHIHLDYVNTRYLGATASSGTLFEAIERFSRFKASLKQEEMEERALQAVALEVSHGVQAIRSHVDITDPKLTALKALLSVKEKLKDKVDLQLVAFPQEGIYAWNGGCSLELLEEALRLGCEVAGAIPHYEFTREDGIKSLQEVFRLAEKYGTLVDVHCDETDDEASRFVETVAALARAGGMGSRVTASHTCALGSVNNAYAFKMMAKFVQAGINFVACPTENCYLQGRYDSYPRRRGLTRIDELYHSGLNLSFAQDSIADPWYPLGNGNLINQLDFGLHLAHLMDDEVLSHALDFISSNAMRTLGLPVPSIAAGQPASFVVLDAASDREAVQQRAAVLLSVRRGRLLLRREPARVTFNATAI